MFGHMMVPVDLTHAEALERALSCAGQIAKLYDIPVTYVGVTSSAPDAFARTTREYGQKLDAFAGAQAERHGIHAKTHVCVVNDLPTEVDDALMRAIDALDADLVVMASHVPGRLEYIWPSNGGKIASHAKCSVVIVRG